MPPQALQRSSKIYSLGKILLQEQNNEFDDSAVLGGLDRFLQRWEADLKPLLGRLPLYSQMLSSQRKRWASEILTRLKLLDKGQGPKTSTPKRKPETKAQPSPGDLTLEDDITRLRGVTSSNITRFHRLGLHKIRDLVYLFPRRHNDFAHICKIADLVPGQEQTIVATVWEASEVTLGRRMRSTQAVLGDETGNMRVVWFNQPYLAKSFHSGDWLVVSGKVSVFKSRKVMESPEYELLKGQEELVHTGRLVPVYPSVEGLPQRTLRRLVNLALKIGVPQLKEFLTAELLHRTGLVSLHNAVSQAHYPDSELDKNAARRRLAFDELFLMQLAVLSRKRAWQKRGEGIPLKAESKLLEAFLGGLPFTLTPAQDKVLKEILADLASEQPMSRLLQGEVGSGKTVVALAALLVAVFNGHQGALMAPTEILAEQHLISVSNLLPGLARPLQGENHLSMYLDSFPRPISVGLLLGSLPRRAKEEMRQRLAAGTVDIIIGTHALIQGEVEIPRLALAVVDEQHRFGVTQRASLREKGGRPHLLAMSATPIPRSLALTLYGDLDISTIDQLPPGRQQIRTRRVTPDQRERAYNFIRREVRAERQAFIICPLIEESETVQARAAVEEHRRLSEEVFPDLRLGLIHGRIPLKEKQATMQAFQERKIDIMVSTAVVEVGIDVPNATVMLIDGADRFGLAQLHQFRGRVGRGPHQSYCLLMADSPSLEVRERLRVLERTNDGFAVAEEDLRFRGPGDYLGTRQSGLPNLRMARLSDQDILTLARREASRLLDSDLSLAREEHRPLAEEMGRYAAGLASEMS